MLVVESPCDVNWNALSRAKYIVARVLYAAGIETHPLEGKIVDALNADDLLQVPARARAA